MVGGIATSPVRVKADASIKVALEAEASVNVNIGMARTKPMAATGATSKAAAKKTTKARTTKGTGTVRKTLINVNKKSVWKKASSLPGG